MNYSLHPEAVREFDKATGYYREILPSLSNKFEDDFDSTLERVLSFPNAWPLMKGGFRRCLLKRFPFGIIYKVDKKKDMCLIFAVMHLHRNPDYWEDREF